MNAPIWANMVGEKIVRDIMIAPPLEAQLSILDGLVDRPQDYAVRWTIAMAQNGVLAIAEVERGQAHLVLEFRADEHDKEREARARALCLHMDRASLREIVVADLERRSPKRTLVASRREAARVLRAFLRAGYRTFLTPQLAIEESGSLPLAWFRTDDDAHRAEIERAGRNYIRLRRAGWGDRFVRRAIRMLGKPHKGSGCIVLEAAHV